jgi:hypothetical protein
LSGKDEDGVKKMQMDINSKQQLVKRAFHTVMLDFLVISVVGCTMERIDNSDIDVVGPDAALQTDSTEIIDTMTEAVVDTDTEPDTATTSKLETQDTEGGGTTDEKSDFGTDSEPRHATDSDITVDTDSERETTAEDTATATETETKDEIETDSDSETETANQIARDSETETNSQTEPDTLSETDNQIARDSESQTESDTLSDTETVTVTSSSDAGLNHDDSETNRDSGVDSDTDICIPDCPENGCGEDGCGGICGTCIEPETCNANQQCERAPGYGDTCLAPFIVHHLPYSLSSDTTLAGNDYRFVDDVCPGAATGSGYESGDEVFAFTPEQSGVYTIWVKGYFNPVVYIVTDCKDIDTSCQAGRDRGMGPAHPEEIAIEMAADTTYYIIVDGAHKNVALEGAYTLTISEPCLPDCSGGRECGEDGCGFTCGECLPGAYCDEAGFCQPYDDLGDSCHNPFVIPDAPYSDEADLADFLNIYRRNDDACNVAFGHGEDSPEVVYFFVPQTTGVYRLSVESDAFMNTITVVTDCTRIVDTCQAALNEELGKEIVLDVQLEAQTAYFIIVDGRNELSPDKIAPFSFSISEPSSLHAQI